MRARGDRSAVERRGSGGKSLETLVGRERLKMERETEAGEKGGGKIIKIEQVISLQRRGPLEQSLHLNS